MPIFEVTITQTEVRTYKLNAPTRDQAQAVAEAWNENPTGDTPDGALDYSYTFDSETHVVNVLQNKRQEYMEKCFTYKEQAAMVLLQDIINAGVEFPDACTVVVTHSQIPVDRLRQMYDELQAIL